MRLLGETGRGDDGENDNLMGARACLQPTLRTYAAYRPRPTTNRRRAGRSIRVGVGLCRTIILMAIDKRNNLPKTELRLPKVGGRPWHGYRLSKCAGSH